jgi:hypothetical protein
MVWVFERSVDLRELETRYDNETSEFVLELRGPELPPQTEWFTDAEAFRVRLVALERILGDQRWRRRGPPISLPSGWPVLTPST